MGAPRFDDPRFPRRADDSNGSAGSCAGGQESAAAGAARGLHLHGLPAGDEGHACCASALLDGFSVDDVTRAGRELER